MHPLHCRHSHLPVSLPALKTVINQSLFLALSITAVQIMCKLIYKPLGARGLLMRWLAHLVLAALTGPNRALFRNFMLIRGSHSLSRLVTTIEGPLSPTYGKLKGTLLTIITQQAALIQGTSVSTNRIHGTQTRHVTTLFRLQWVSLQRGLHYEHYDNNIMTP